MDLFDMDSKRANCFYCGGRLIFEEKKESALQCPACNAFMKKVVRADITVDECPSCRGCWYDRSELEQLLRKNKSDLEAQAQEEPQEEPEAPQIEEPYGWQGMRKSQIGQPLPRKPPPKRQSTRNSQSKISTPFNAAYRRCPHCKDMMNRSNYLKSGIIVDVCRKHGVYLDQGEFDDLHQFMLHNPMGF